MMRRLPLLLSLVLLLSACASTIPCRAPMPDDDPLTFRFGCPAMVATAAPRAREISVTNQANGAVSVIFTNAGVNLQPPGTLLAGSWSSLLRFPIDSNATQPVRLNCTLGGHVNKTANASASAVVHVGGVAEIVSFPFGAAVEENLSRQFEVTVAPGTPVVNVGVSITGSRASASDVAILEIDDVDCALVRP